MTLIAESHMGNVPAVLRADMEYLTANLESTLQRLLANGREWLVAPLTLLVPGVLDGSEGPLLYPPEVTSADVDRWNGMPLTVYHPTMNGRAVSARDPNVLMTQNVGHLYRVTHNTDGVLRGEGWFDVDLLRRVDPRVLNALETKQPMELSTGLGVVKEAVPTGTVYNGKDKEGSPFSKPYSHVVKAMHPDHLAILPDKTGACSIKDGCGVLINELSHGQTRTLLQIQLKSRFTQDQPYCYVVEVYDDYFIYEQNDDLYQMTYTSTDAGVTVSGTPVKVVRKTTYLATNTEDLVMNKTQLVDWLVANCDCWKGKEDRTLLNGMTEDKLKLLKDTAEGHGRTQVVANAAKTGIVDSAGNTHTWNDQTGRWDFKPAPNTPVSAPSPSLPTAPSPHSSPSPTVKQLTEAEWLAQAPPGIQSAVRNSMLVEQREKQVLVERLTVNVVDPAHKQAATVRLMSKDMQELTELVALLPPLPYQTYPSPGHPAPTYYGAGGGPTLLTDNEQKDVLDLDGERAKIQTNHPVSRSA